MLLNSKVLALVTITCCNRIVIAIPYEDEILSLPLFDQPLPTPQFSGYLNGTDGCDTIKNGDCYIHYWFCLADDSDDNGGSTNYDDESLTNDYPVVLWLNGGPGSSSVLGLLQELGPLLFNATGDGFMINPYSWTKLPANVLIIESPIGVGYSYCSSQEDDDGVCVNTDSYTATTSRAAIVDFFINKFPEFRHNKFYITGESYAGVYIPTLAYEIVLYNHHPYQENDDNKINLVGVAVGDPCTDNIAQQDSMDALWYSNKYGLMDDQIYDTLWNKCEIRIPLPIRDTIIQIPPNHYNNDISSLLHSNQRKNPHKLIQQVLKRQILPYNITRRLEEDFTTTSATDRKECDLAWKKFLFSSSNGLSQSWENLYIDDYSLYAFVTDDEDNAMQKYMNRPDVRMALHVTATPNVVQWPYPNGGFDYTKEYNACNDDAINTNALSMIDFYYKIIPYLSGGTWIYNGDTDPCVSYEGTRTAVKRIGISELDGGSYRPWFYNHTATSIQLLSEKAINFGPNLIVQNAGIQLGGEVINYEDGLSFITIHGSGHMVPQFRPQAAFHMLSKLICNCPNNDDTKLLSPLLPLNDTLMTASDSDFDQLMDSWTIRAKHVTSKCCME